MLSLADLSRALQIGFVDRPDGALPYDFGTHWRNYSNNKEDTQELKVNSASKRRNGAVQ